MWRTDRRTDGPTDRQTDGPTDGPTRRGVESRSTRLKSLKGEPTQEKVQKDVEEISVWRGRKKCVAKKALKGDVSIFFFSHFRSRRLFQQTSLDAFFFLSFLTRSLSVWRGTVFTCLYFWAAVSMGQCTVETIAMAANKRIFEGLPNDLWFW